MATSDVRQIGDAGRVAPPGPSAAGDVVAFHSFSGGDNRRLYFRRLGGDMQPVGDPILCEVLSYGDAGTSRTIDLTLCLPALVAGDLILVRRGPVRAVDGGTLYWLCVAPTFIRVC